MQKITLASASPRRKELLVLAGFSPEVVPSSVEEKITGADPSKAAEGLSRIKCLDVAEKKKSAAGRSVVLGSDTIVVLDDRILGKPKDRENACRMLRRLQGRKHQVITGVTIALVEDGSIRETDTFSSRTDVWVASMSEEEIHAYVETGDPLDKAGAYGIQGPFARFVEKIEGDYYTVVGLPVAAVYRHLKRFL
jgi:septum formation protein